MNLSFIIFQIGGTVLVIAELLVILMLASGTISTGARSNKPDKDVTLNLVQPRHKTYRVYHKTYRVYHKTYRVYHKTYRVYHTTYRVYHNTYRVYHKT